MINELANKTFTTEFSLCDLTDITVIGRLFISVILWPALEVKCHQKFIQRKTSVLSVHRLHT